MLRIDGPSENPDPHYAVTVKASPENGRANAAVIAVVAEHFNVSEDKVRIVRGHASRQKVLIVENPHPGAS